ncbi:hypothetical protein [Paradevosia shaoguanensis]|uniref:Uncharacterized protein n=1 Tax=Paradevosia shaoguanensis TaxID=1335043 RepID=A0AA41QKG6_9HYPH|nr:hypothetical protein [Paradevosia shaoguanensis]MCF1742049.1 hypothetical protein [Paradevosia shaoguanensis]MCI0126532.1 hypothetical protein [Paradevosia shaoguanensis]
MATLPSTGANAPGKSYPHSFPIEPPRLIGGLIQHPLVSASTQVKILEVVDDTGSASVADIIAELPDHPDPVSAILVMVELRILVLEVDGVVDANTVVRRADPEPDPEDQGGRPAAPGGGSGAAASGSIISDFSVGGDTLPAPIIPDGLTRLDVAAFAPNVVVGSGAERRAFGHRVELRRPGVYALIGPSGIYIGTGGDVGQRVAIGQQPIGDIETVVVITDGNGSLGEDDARACERMLWARVADARERVLINGLPDGASVDAQRYSELEAFLGSACLALRHSGVLFTAGSARSVLAGPRQEPGRVGSLRQFNEIPPGEVLELTFGAGLVALAARQSETRWILLQGSDVRTDTVASANATTRYLRAAWRHVGLLEMAPDGRSLVATRDLIFRSCGGLTQFCTGSKGRTLESWKAIAPDGGFDPETPALIAA